MRTSRLRTLLKKELIDVVRNRAALAPVSIVAVLSLALPFLLAIVIPKLTGHPLNEDSDLVRVSAAIGATPGLTGQGRIQLFLFQQFLLLFLLMPITGAMALAAHAVVGEKLARTLEPLLATPLTTTELLVAKVLGALVPTLAISFAALAIYVAVIVWQAEPGVAPAMFGARSVLLVGLVGPAAALVSLQTAVVISSRVNDPRTAQQFGVLIIIPLTGLLIAQFTGTIWLSATTVAEIGVGLLAVWALLTLLSVALFDRETILTRWR